MAHRGVKNSALSVGNRHNHGLVSLALFTISRGQDLDVFGRTSEGIVQLVLGMHPNLGHALRNGVLRISKGNLERTLRTMASPASGSRIADEFSLVVKIKIRA